MKLLRPIIDFDGVDKLSIDELMAVIDKTKQCLNKTMVQFIAGLELANIANMSTDKLVTITTNFLRHVCEHDNAGVQPVETDILVTLDDIRSTGIEEKISVVSGLVSSACSIQPAFKVVIKASDVITKTDIATLTTVLRRLDKMCSAIIEIDADIFIKNKDAYITLVCPLLNAVKKQDVKFSVDIPYYEHAAWYNIISDMQQYVDKTLYIKQTHYTNMFIENKTYGVEDLRQQFLNSISVGGVKKPTIFDMLSLEHSFKQGCFHTFSIVKNEVLLCSQNKERTLTYSEYGVLDMDYIAQTGDILSGN